MTVRFLPAMAAATIAALAMLAVAGCSSQTTETSAQVKAGDYAELNFDLGKCLPIEPNLYKCPAIDKPVCNPEFANADVQCVRVDKNGSVEVLSYSHQ